MVDAIEKKFHSVMGPINEHVIAFEKFKERISVGLLAACRELEAFKVCFKDFARESGVKLGNFPVFK